MQDLLNKLTELIALRQQATPGPWDVLPNYEGRQEWRYITPSKPVDHPILVDWVMRKGQLHNVGLKINDQNTAYLKALFALDFDAVAAALQVTPAPAAPLADAELAELAALEQQATPAPWDFSAADDGCEIIVGRNWQEVCYTGNSLHAPEDAKLIKAMRNALPGLLARLAAAEAHSATLQGALESSADTNRVLAVRLKAAADALPEIAKQLSDAVGEVDAEFGGVGDGYEQCYNAADNATANLRALGRVLDGKEQPHA